MVVVLVECLVKGAEMETVYPPHPTSPEQPYVCSDKQEVDVNDSRPHDPAHGLAGSAERHRLYLECQVSASGIEAREIRAGIVSETPQTDMTGEGKPPPSLHCADVWN